MTDSADSQTDARARPHVRLLPMALAVIVVVTAVSVEVSYPFIDQPAANRVVTPDIFFNLLLYMPLGIALRKRRLGVIVLLAAAVSAFAESIQLFYPNRVPSPVDVVANALGAAIGALAARSFAALTRRDPSVVLVGRPTGVLAIVVCLLLVFTMSNPNSQTDFSNWDPSFEFAFGNELSGDRLWHGEIQQMAIFAQEFDRKTVARLYREGPGSIPSTDADGNRAIINTQHRVSDVDSIWGQPLLDTGHTRELFDRLVESSSLTILVWLRTYESSQGGPARIVTFSRDPHVRNFTLAQDHRRLVFRLRTPQTPHGMYPRAQTPEFLKSNTDVFAVATYDGRVSRIYVDGRLLARLNLMASGWRLDFLADSGLPAATMLTAVLMSIGFLGLLGPAANKRRWALAPLGGLVGAGLLMMVGGAAALPEFALWVPVLGLGGGVLVAGSIERTPQRVG